MAIFDDDERRDRPQSPSALRVATGRADGFVAPPCNTPEYSCVVASRPRRRRARHKRERNYEMGSLVPLVKCGRLLYLEIFKASSGMEKLVSISIDTFIGVGTEVVALCLD